MRKPRGRKKVLCWCDTHYADTVQYLTDLASRNRSVIRSAWDGQAFLPACSRKMAHSRAVRNRVDERVSLREPTIIQHGSSFTIVRPLL